MNTRRVNLLALAGGLLVLSLLVAVLSPTSFTPDGGRGYIVLAWIQHTAFWSGMLCLAAHLLGLVLNDRVSQPQV